MSKLKEVRINAGYSVHDISKRINVRKQYLIDLEEENFEKIPGQIYVEGYIKLYSEFLGVDYKKFLPPKKVKKRSRDLRAKYISPKVQNNKTFQKYVVFGAILSLILVFVAYGYIKKSQNHHSNNHSTIIGHGQY